MHLLQVCMMLDTLDQNIEVEEPHDSQPVHQKGTFTCTFYVLHNDLHIMKVIYISLQSVVFSLNHKPPLPFSTPLDPKMNEQKKLPILAIASIIFFFFFHHYSILLSSGQLLPIDEDDRIQTYIVHVQRPEATEFLRESDRKRWHQSFLPNATLDSGERRLVYSYDHSIGGFAARLTLSEVRAMESLDGFLQAQLDELRPLLTTHTPEFLGLSDRFGPWYENSYGSGAIVGVLDTGVDPAHPSFRDVGMKPPPPPHKWDGHCEFRDSLCNNKLIGAVAFSGGKPMAIDAADDDGHGTHVASVAAGTFVDGADVLGNANGTAVGMAPGAHLAIYKVCSKSGCLDSDVLAGIDRAIRDGVDVISISAGHVRPRPFYEDSVAMGSFAASRRRILTIAAAGNGGPKDGTVVNDAPWLLTVGATSTDRRIQATVKLGNRTELVGESAHRPTSFNSSSSPMVLVFPGFDGQNGTKGCHNVSFVGVDVKGKIVLCEASNSTITHIKMGKSVKAAGGAAMIVLNQYEQGLTTFAELHVLPVVHMGFPESVKLVSYFNSSVTNSTPATAAIAFDGTRFGAPSSPSVAYFSSRGPSATNGGILKPDIVGPGVNILAAWPTTSAFNFLTGTSIATAHLSGIAALLKSGHRRWSPAEIKSAIITTAEEINRDGLPIAADEYNGTTAASFFAMGAGHVNATRANDPGLVYDESHSQHQYIRYLCGLGYTNRQVLVIVQHQVDCSRVHEDSADELNYPSIALSLGSPSSKTIRRRVKNVGEANAVYFAEVEGLEGVTVEVSPNRLEFKSLYERKHFSMVFTADRTKADCGQVSKGHLSWVSKQHTVRSPISITF